MTQQNEKQPKAKTGLARCLELASLRVRLYGTRLRVK